MGKITDGFEDDDTANSVLQMPMPIATPVVQFAPAFQTMDNKAFKVMHYASYLAAIVATLHFVTLCILSLEIFPFRLPSKFKNMSHYCQERNEYRCAMAKTVEVVPIVLMIFSFGLFISILYNMVLSCQILYKYTDGRKSNAIHQFEKFNQGILLCSTILFVATNYWMQPLIHNYRQYEITREDASSSVEFEIGSFKKPYIFKVNCWTHFVLLFILCACATALEKVLALALMVVWLIAAVTFNFYLAHEFLYTTVSVPKYKPNDSYVKFFKHETKTGYNNVWLSYPFSNDFRHTATTFCVTGYIFVCILLIFLHYFSKEDRKRREELIDSLDMEPQKTSVYVNRLVVLMWILSIATAYLCIIIILADVVLLDDPKTAYLGYDENENSVNKKTYFLLVSPNHCLRVVSWGTFIVSLVTSIVLCSCWRDCSCESLQCGRDTSFQHTPRGQVSPMGYPVMPAVSFRAYNSAYNPQIGQQYSIPQQQQTTTFFEPSQ